MNFPLRLPFLALLLPGSKISEFIIECGEDFPCLLGGLAGLHIGCFKIAKKDKRIKKPQKTGFWMVLVSLHPSICWVNPGGHLSPDAGRIGIDLEKRHG